MCMNIVVYTYTCLSVSFTCLYLYFQSLCIVTRCLFMCIQIITSVARSTRKNSLVTDKLKLIGRNVTLLSSKWTWVFDIMLHQVAKAVFLWAALFDMA